MTNQNLPVVTTKIEHGTDLTLTSPAPIDPDAAAEKTLRKLQILAATVDKQERTSRKQRLQLTIEQYHFIHGQGGPEGEFFKREIQVAGHTEKPRDRLYRRAALVCDGTPPLPRPAQRSLKHKEISNATDWRAHLMEVLDAEYGLELQDDASHLNPEDLYNFVMSEGGLTQAVSNFRRGKIASKSNQEERHDYPLERLLESPSAMTVALEGAALQMLIPGLTTTLVGRREGDCFVCVPRFTPNTPVEQMLHDHDPHAQINICKDLDFYGQMFAVGEAIPDTMSDEPADPIEEGEMLLASTERLPSNTAYLWGGGKFSIAGSRVHDSIVIQVRPVVDLALPTTILRVMDDRERSALQPLLAPLTSRAAFDLPRKAKEAWSAKHSGAQVSDPKAVSLNTRVSVRLNFVHVAGKKYPLSLLPMIEFSVKDDRWTLGIAKFEPAGTAVLSWSETEEMREEFFAPASKDKHPIEVAVGKRGLVLTRARSGPWVRQARATGRTSVRVMGEDFRQVMARALHMRPPAGIDIGIDPNGLVRVRFATAVAEFELFMQTIAPNTDPAIIVRERRLLMRLDRHTG